MEAKEAKETVEDILAQMRCGTIPKHRTDHELLALYADRISKAWKREAKAIATENAVLPAVCITKAVGNMAAMREALEAANRFVGNLEIEPYSPLDDAASELRQIIMDAISAPPRNCDTGKDAKTLLDDYISIKRVSSDNQIRALYDLALPVIVWLLAPSAERKGEGDGR